MPDFAPSGRAPLEPSAYGENSGRPATSGGMGPPPGPRVPQTSGSPGIKGPKQIMIDRRAREEKKKLAAQMEREERARREEERRILEERRLSDERKAMGAGGGNGGGKRGGNNGNFNSQRHQRTASGRASSGEQPAVAAGMATSIPVRGSSGAALGVDPTAQKRAQRAAAAAAQAQQSSQQTPNPGMHDSGFANQEDSPSRNPTGSTGKTRTSFPHAFERWESLSAHWEGLTSYWIRKLEENTRLLDSDPISMHLAHQVTDLAAAGANLFHAVVELQRLRASSERKFQRWFFDTRAETERLGEVNGQLQKLLNEERAGRKHAIEEAVEEAKKASSNDKAVQELKRELEISKSEARRAWEELGRREQEERERVASLKEGMQTMVGDVAVIPMMPGHTRNTSTSARQRPATREGPYPGGPSAAIMGGMEEDYTPQRTVSGRPLPDPFSVPTTQAGQPAQTNLKSSSTSAASTARQQGPSSNTTPPDPRGTAETAAPQSLGSYGYDEGYDPYPASPGVETDDGTEYEVDEDGNYLLDERGNRIRYPVLDPSQIQYSHTTNVTSAPASAPAPASTTSSGGTYLAPADYEGQEYGSGDGWEGIARHQHMTRLSDVIEEDERSRTSASQVSRRD